MATTVTLKPNAIDLSGSTSGTTTLQASAVAGTTTVTLPAATDTLVGKATTDTLTNKTLTSPTMTAPVLGTPASGTVTNLTGTASININGTVGATTATTGAFTTITGTTGTFSDKVTYSLGSTTSPSNGVGCAINFTASTDAAKYAGMFFNGSTVYNSFFGRVPSALSGVNDAVGYLTDGTLRALFSSTGLNSTVIGATTPAAGSFTTLSASDTVTFNKGENYVTAVASVGTTYTGFRLQNTGGQSYFGKDNSTGGNFNTGVAYANVFFDNSSKPFMFVTGGSVVAAVSTTGLAVTGTLSASGKTVFGSGTSNSINFVQAVGASEQFAILTSGGASPNSLNTDFIRLQHIGGAAYFDTHATILNFRTGSGASEDGAARTPLSINGATGAVAVTGTLSATGTLSTSDTTDATSTTAASLKTAGGLAVAKKAYFGDAIYGTYGNFSNTIAGATGTTNTFNTSSLAAASVSVPNNTATTIIAMGSYSLFNGVSLIVGGDEGNISFCAFVSQNGGGAYTLSNLINKNCTLSLSGANLQLTHTLGSTATVKANSFLFAGR